MYSVCPPVRQALWGGHDCRSAGFIDMAVSVRKRAKTFLDDVDQFVDWRPIEKLLKKKLRRHKDAVGNPAYPPLTMFKVQRLQRWWDLSDQGMDDADRSYFLLPVYLVSPGLRHARFRGNLPI